jgi:hypothetical protein
VLTAEEILEVPAVHGGELSLEVRAQLPEQSPPAPWRSNIETVMWGFRATPAAAPALPDGLTPALPVGFAAFIRYLDGAVGPYREILATPHSVRAGRRGIAGYVPFIAVDSIPSIHGGRTNWALPKTYADFEGSPARDARLSGRGADWTIAALVRQHGPWFPIRAGAPCVQPWPGGGTRVFRSSFRGRARLASLELKVRGPDSLTSVLPAGRHFGVVIRGSVTVGAPV